MPETPGTKTPPASDIWRRGLELLAGRFKATPVREPEAIAELLVKLLNGTGEFYGWADMVGHLSGFGLTVEQAHYNADIYLVVDITIGGGPIEGYWSPIPGHQTRKCLLCIVCILQIIKHRTQGWRDLNWIGNIFDKLKMWSTVGVVHARLSRHMSI